MKIVEVRINYELIWNNNRYSNFLKKHINLQNSLNHNPVNLNDKLLQIIKRYSENYI